MIVNIIWRDNKLAHLVSPISLSATRAKLLSTIKPDRSLQLVSNWYWMGGVKGGTLSGVSR